MKRIALVLALLLPAAVARSDLIAERRVVHLYPGPFPGKCVLVFAPADHARLTAALEGTPYHAAFRRAKVAGVLGDGAVPGLVPVILEPDDADRLRRELDRGNAIGTADGRLRDVLYATASRAWAGPEAPPSDLAVAVRPTDLDSKGHVNNARYLEYLQWGRWRWLEDRGLSDDALRKAGAVLVAVRVEIDYRAECRYGDTLTVETTASRDGEKKVVFAQRITRGDGTLAAEAKVTMVAIDPAARKSRPIPGVLAEALGR